MVCSIDDYLYGKLGVKKKELKDLSSAQNFPKIIALQHPRTNMFPPEYKCNSDL
jgi:hypothetical protein